MKPLFGLLTCALLGGTALAQTSTPTTPATQPTPAPTATAPVFKEVPPLSKEPVRQFKQMAWVIDPAKTYRAVLVTSKGNITVELTSQLTPKAVNNFVFLALNHFYDGTRFHRVIDGFMAQGGDPNSADLAKRQTWGQGGPGYGFFVEIDESLKFDKAGVLGMARAQSYFSQGSQFFITLEPANSLTGDYTVFGRVLEGQDVVAKLTKTAGKDNAPIAGAEPDQLLSVKILVSQ